MPLTHIAETTDIAAPAPVSHRGWRVVLAMFLVTATVYGVTVYGFIILSQPLAAERGYSAAASGNLVSAMWLVAPLALFCAPIIKRFGAWRVLIGGLLLEAIAFASVTLTDAFWQLYALRVVMGVGKSLAIVSMPVIVAQWYSKRFGIAIAFAWCGGSFGGLFLSPIAEIMARELGWRPATLWYAGLLLITAGVVAFLGRSAGQPTFSRSDRLSPDATASAGPGAGPDSIRSINWAAAGTMAIAVALSGVGAIAFAVEAPPLMEAIGYSSTAAASILGLSAAGAIVGQLGTGWMLDRTGVRTTSLSIGALTFAGLAIFWLLEANPIFIGAAIAALIVGAGMGGCEVLWITLTKRQFGAGLFAITYGGWSFSYQLGYAVGGGIGGAIFESASVGVFLLAIACFYLPAFVFSIWRPGMRNVE